MSLLTPQRIFKAGILLLLAAGAAYIAYRYDLRILLQDLIEEMQKLGAWSFVLYAALFIVAPLFLFPFALIAVAGGVLFGFFAGWGMISLSCTLSAVLAFFMGRYFFRDSVHRLVHKKKSYKAIDDAVHKEGWRIVALTRLIPLFPYGPLNLFLGSTKIHFKEYIAATWVFMLPGSALHAYIGAIGRDYLITGRLAHSGAEWIVLVFSLVTITGAGIYSARVAKRLFKASSVFDSV